VTIHIGGRGCWSSAGCRCQPSVGIGEGRECVGDFQPCVGRRLDHGSACGAGLEGSCASQSSADLEGHPVVHAWQGGAPTVVDGFPLRASTSSHVLIDAVMHAFALVDMGQRCVARRRRSSRPAPTCLVLFPWQRALRAPRWCCTEVGGLRVASHQDWVCALQPA
jgi:hypothetical protein